MLAPGVLVERYELVSPIGDGGMASVWAARQHGKHGFEKLVALKVIHSRYAEDPTFRTMFLDEASVVASLAHRNVAQVFDLGDTGELLYLVLEYVDGESLYALTAPKRKVPYPIALRIVADACAGIAAVHALTDSAGVLRNIVHRDVSPQNILLSMSGEVNVIDFGIAKARDRNSRTTDINTVKGKLRYMAPEQAKHMPVGPTADVFALGAVLFRLLAGMAPYAAPNDLATIQALLALAPALNKLPPDVPHEIAAIIQQSIAPHTEGRFFSAKAMKEAIEAILAGQPRAPDVAAWVHASLSEQGRQRHALLAARLTSAPSMRAAKPATPEEPRRQGTQAMEARPVPAVPELVGPGGAPERGQDAFPGTAPMAPPIREAPLAPPVREVARASRPEPAAEPPAFMDVHALVAQARAGGIPQTRPATPAREMPPPRLATPERGMSPPTPAHGQQPYPATQPYDGRIELAFTPLRAAEPPRWGSAPKVLGLVLVVTIAIAGILIALPFLVRSRAVAAASAAGFEITLRSAGLGLDGVHLKGVVVRSTRAPGFSATIPQVDASYSLKELRFQSPEILLEGELVDLVVGLGQLLQEDRTKYAGTAAAPRRIAVAGGKLQWNATPGEPAVSGRHFAAEDIALDIDSRGVGNEDVKGSVARTTIQTAQTTFGPWAASLERTPSTVRVRVSFDPPIADGPSALFIAGASVPTELTVRIPRYQWAHLGVVPTDLGLTTDPTSELQLDLAATLPSTAKSSVTLDATVYRLKVKAFKSPLDVHATGSASGPPGKKALNIDKMNITAGPFSATATGTITPRDDGVRLDALFKVTPIGCDKLATLAGGVAAFVQSLGQTTGAFGLNGTLNVSGVVKYDSASPEDAAMTWLAKESCGVSIFGL